LVDGILIPFRGNKGAFGFHRIFCFVNIEAKNACRLS
jgi:hypothetical protein